MYFYLVDDFVADRRYAGAVDQIEARLNELGIRGRFQRLTVLKNVRELVSEAFKRGAETIVAVGDDRTVSKMVTVVAEVGATFGLIPVGPQQAIARFLGIPDGVSACDILSRRIVESVDLGKANDRYFLLSLDAPVAQFQLTCDGQYRVTPQNARSLSIRNFGTPERPSNPRDGQLEAIIGGGIRRGVFSGLFRRAPEDPSVLPFKRLTITSEQPLALTLDGQTIVKTPATIEATPKRLKIVVGKERKF